MCGLGWDESITLVCVSSTIPVSGTKIKDKRKNC